MERLRRTLLLQNLDLLAFLYKEIQFLKKITSLLLLLIIYH